MAPAGQLTSETSGSRRLQTPRPHPHHLVAFDLLAVDGQLLIHRPHTERRQLLEHLAGLAPEALTTVPSYPAVDVDDLLAACDELDLEGLVLKRRNSVYRPGARSRDWRKVKTTAWRTRHLPARQAAMDRRHRAV